MKFDRTGSEKLIENLKKEKLFEKLINDKDVFMALRKNEIDFYYKGAKLFGYEKKGFKSHIKYCFNADFEDDYVFINELGQIKPITDIENNLDKIKKNVEKYSTKEKEGVGELYKFGVFHSEPEDRYVLLDVEIAFSEKEENINDRIDMLWFDKEEKELKFIEAKDFSNKEISVKENLKENEKHIINQIKRYNRTIEKYYDDILNEYKKYVEILNNHFGLNLPLPEKIYKKTKLLIFGFNEEQRRKELKKIKEFLIKNRIELYSKGNIKKDVKPEQIYK